MTASDAFTGCMPALMTPCRVTPDGERAPDFDPLVHTAKGLVEAGMSAVVYCGSMGDWPLLTDAQRMEGVARLAGAGIPTVVGTGAMNTRAAADHARHAAEVGARGLMLIPRVLSRGSSPAAQEQHFRAVLEAGQGFPAVIYNSPYYGFETRAELFFRLRESHPNLVGFKEFGGAASLSYAAEHITGADPGLSLMVGVDTQVVHGYLRCGARGAITGIGNAIPREVLRLIELCEAARNGDAGAGRLARELDEALAVLARFDEGPDLVLFYKRLMELAGHEGYGTHFNEGDALSPAQASFLEARWEQFRGWWERWPGRG